MWLLAPSAELASRLVHDDSDVRCSRWRHDGARSSACVAQREPAYEAAAHVQVDTDGRAVDEVADAVLEEYRAWNG